MNTEQILSLLEAEGVGRKTVHYLLSTDSTVSTRSTDLRDLLDVASRQVRWIHVPSVEQIDSGIENARRIMDQAERAHITVLTPTHPLFPPSLRTIPNPPVVLFARGNVECLSAQAVAIIGTREPSEYGYQMAERFGAMFADRGFTVTSGLAIGCDTGAHRGCLSREGNTVAVLAHGVDSVYPAQNKELAEQIVAQSGCLVSEYPPGEKPRRNYFVERDRIQSGLSMGVVVVETDIQGGTMHTVRFCLDEGKPLACLSHPSRYADHPKGNGNRYLIQQGQAFPLATKDDVGDFINLLCAEPELCSSCAKSGDAQLMWNFEDI